MTQNVREKQVVQPPAQICSTSIAEKRKRGLQSSKQQQVETKKVKTATAVNDFEQNTVQTCSDLVKNFQAGRLKEHAVCWEKLSSDPSILHIVKGYNIEFETTPHQAKNPRQSGHLHF